MSQPRKNKPMKIYDAAKDGPHEFIVLVEAIDKKTLHIELRTPERPEPGDLIKALNGEMFRFVKVEEFKSTRGGGVLSNLYSALIQPEKRRQL